MTAKFDQGVSDLVAEIKRSGVERFPLPTPDAVDRALEIAATNARYLEREQLAAFLESELFNEHEGSELEQAYRTAWNHRSKSLIERLRAKQP